jgi:hypothetical protein
MWNGRAGNGESGIISRTIVLTAKSTRNGEKAIESPMAIRTASNAGRKSTGFSASVFAAFKSVLINQINSLTIFNGCNYYRFVIFNSIPASILGLVLVAQIMQRIEGD